MTMELHDKGDRWRCFVRGCRTAKNEFGLRKHTWLDGSHVPYRKVVLFIYCWSKEMTSIEFCKTELGLSSKTVVDWSNFLREVCAAELLANPVVLGGPGRVVEVDESQFSRRKNHQERMLSEQWVFGGICRRTRECFMFTVPDRSGPTLLPIIQQSIAPGTTIMSDMWAAYKRHGLCPFASKSHLQFRGPTNWCAHTEH